VDENFTRSIWERGLKSQDIFNSWSLLKFSMFDVTNMVPRGTSPAVSLNVGIDVQGSITGAVLGLVLFPTVEELLNWLRVHPTVIKVNNVRRG